MRFLVFTLLFFHWSNAQNGDYKVSALPEELTKNANAVVLLEEMDIEIESQDFIRYRYQKIITVLNREGNSAIENYAHYDGVSKLRDLNAEIYDETGEAIKRIKSKDFKDITAIDGFTIYTDSRVKYFDFTPLSYPYTVAFSYTRESSNTAFIPFWNPIDRYEIGVLKSSYKISYPEEMTIRKMEKNFQGQPITKSLSLSQLHYEITNVPAIKNEMLSPEPYKLAPRLMVSVDNFHLEGVDGFANNWLSLGQWQNENLLQNQDYLAPETIRNLGAQLSGIEDQLEKTRLIYKYVQENTRYVSVQLGIGGWKPISAQEVDRVKYGDCKGLTNYTKALLKSQGIPSYYSVVWAGPQKRDMEKEFASIQGNHVILNVPLEDHDIWLECTSQDIPFGYLGDFTDDRDVLVVKPEGGILKHTPAYLNEDNHRLITSSCTISDSGSMEAQVEIESRGIIYDQRSKASGYSDKKQDEYYKEFWDNINGLEITEIRHINDKENVVVKESIALKSSGFATKIGNDFLIKINPFDMDDGVPLRYRSRKLPFEIQRGYLHESKGQITIPDRYVVADLPHPIKISNDFGEYEIHLEIDAEGQLKYRRKLLIRKGYFSSNRYNSYRNFKRDVAKYDNMKIMINQKI